MVAQMKINDLNANMLFVSTIFSSCKHPQYYRCEEEAAAAAKKSFIHSFVNTHKHRQECVGGRMSVCVCESCTYQSVHTHTCRYQSRACAYVDDDEDDVYMCIVHVNLSVAERHFEITFIAVHCGRFIPTHQNVNPNEFNNRLNAIVALRPNSNLQKQ